MTRYRLLLLTTCLMVEPSAICADEAEERTVAIIEKAGGLVSPQKVDGKPAIFVYFRRDDVPEHVFEAMGVLKELRGLHIDSRTRVSGMKAIGALAQLRDLSLSDTPISDGDLRRIAALKELRSLHFCGGKDVTDAGAKELAKLTRLHDLTACGTQITAPSGLRDLAALKDVRKLWLDGTPVTDEGVKELHAMRVLTTLYLRYTKVTDDGLKELIKFNSLRSLTLHETGVTDAGLEILSGMKQLEYLDVQGTKVTKKGIAALRKALPKCDILP